MLTCDSHWVDYFLLHWPLLTARRLCDKRSDAICQRVLRLPLGTNQWDYPDKGEPSNPSFASLPDTSVIEFRWFITQDCNFESVGMKGNLEYAP